MAYIEPNGEVRLLRVPWDSQYVNTMFFPNLTAQDLYMQSKVYKTFNNLSYTRKSKGKIRVEATMAECYNANYMMYKNTNFENKWFYAFITSVEYINNITVEINFEIDVIQSWIFDNDFEFNECFIERQHSITDVIGENTIPENLETGEYVCDNALFAYFNPAVVIASDAFYIDANGDINVTNLPNSKIYNGRESSGNIYSGISYYAIPLSDVNVVQKVDDIIAELNNAGKVDSIISVFIAPYSFFPPAQNNDSVHTVNLSVQTTVGAETGYYLGTYAPRNKKLMTYPFNMLYVTGHENNGTAYYYELFDNPNAITFEYWGNKSCTPGVITYPLNYKGRTREYEESVTVTSFPLCTWVNDTFRAWLSQNAGSIGASILSAGLQIATHSSGLGYNPVDTGYGTTLEYNEEAPAVGGVHGAIAMLGSAVDHAIKPPTNHGNGNGNLIYQAGMATFMYGHKHIREEYAKIADAFFDMFGYAQHKLAKPNLNARPRYTYVKTMDCSVSSGAPADDERKIENIFNKGIRFWTLAAASKFGSYDPTDNPNYPV